MGGAGVGGDPPGSMFPTTGHISGHFPPGRVRRTREAGGYRRVMRKDAPRIAWQTGGNPMNGFEKFPNPVDSVSGSHAPASGRSWYPRPSRVLAGSAIAGALACAAVFPWGPLSRMNPPAPVARASDSPHRRATAVLWAARDRRLATGPESAAARAELAAADPGRTGLVGVETSPFTTTAGSLDAKRLSADPAWVPAFAAWYREAGLRPGDPVAICASGSFPGLLLSARLAADSAGLRTTVTASFTASAYGANVPGFDLWDMDTALRDAGVPVAPITSLTPGGDDDAARDLEPAARAALVARLAEIGRAGPGAVETTVPATRAAAVSWRTARMGLAPGNAAAARPRLLVNIGGNCANIGTGDAALAWPKGLSGVGAAAAEAAGPAGSVMDAARRAGVPVLHLLDIRALAARSGVGGGGDSPAAGPIRRSVAGACAAAMVAALWVGRVKKPGWRGWADAARPGANPAE